MLLAATAGIFTPLPSHAAGEVSEAAVKAAFLPRFARYVEWPRQAFDPQRTLQVCVVGEDRLGSALQQATTNDSTGGRPVVIRRLATADGADACHVAYVTGSPRQSIGQALAALRQRPVLTVTDAQSGNAKGVIHFVLAGGRVRFFIDEAEAARKGLTVSSRLLGLAIGVRKR